MFETQGVTIFIKGILVVFSDTIGNHRLCEVEVFFSILIDNVYMGISMEWNCHKLRGHCCFYFVVLDTLILVSIITSFVLLGCYFCLLFEFL